MGNTSAQAFLGHRKFAQMRHLCGDICEDAFGSDIYATKARAWGRTVDGEVHGGLVAGHILLQLRSVVAAVVRLYGPRAGAEDGVETAVVVGQGAGVANAGGGAVVPPLRFKGF